MLHLLCGKSFRSIDKHPAIQQLIALAQRSHNLPSFDLTKTKTATEKFNRHPASTETKFLGQFLKLDKTISSTVAKILNKRRLAELH